ncbi:uncharacterized protein LOC117609461 isoform X1 [Osmia lignaria lignaria]|uniref:uncharacterized protein LOC117609461 isoform X1 n=1 Tax=Osmia lignaria lignaria TaxID=1437193 RepID=UPI00402BD9F8
MGSSVIELLTKMKVSVILLLVSVSWVVAFPGPQWNVEEKGKDGSSRGHESLIGLGGLIGGDGKDGGLLSGLVSGKGKINPLELLVKKGDGGGKGKEDKNLEWSSISKVIISQGGDENTVNKLKGILAKGEGSWGVNEKKILQQVSVLLKGEGKPDLMETIKKEVEKLGKGGGKGHGWSEGRIEHAQSDVKVKKESVGAVKESHGKKSEHGGIKITEHSGEDHEEKGRKGYKSSSSSESHSKSSKDSSSGKGSSHSHGKSSSSDSHSKSSKDSSSDSHSKSSSSSSSESSEEWHNHHGKRRSKKVEIRGHVEHKNIGHGDHKKEVLVEHKNEGHVEHKNEEHVEHKVEGHAEHKVEGHDHKREVHVEHKPEIHDEHKVVEQVEHKVEGHDEHKAEEHGKEVQVELKKDGHDDHKTEGHDEHKVVEQVEHKVEGHDEHKAEEHGKEVQVDLKKDEHDDLKGKGDVEHKNVEQVGHGKEEEVVIEVQVKEQITKIAEEKVLAELKKSGKGKEKLTEEEKKICSETIMKKVEEQVVIVKKGGKKLEDAEILKIGEEVIEKELKEGNLLKLLETSQKTEVVDEKKEVVSKGKDDGMEKKI